MSSFAELLFWVVCHITCIVSPNGLCIPLMHMWLYSCTCFLASAGLSCCVQLPFVLSCMPSVCFFYDLGCIGHIFTLNCYSLIWSFTHKVMTSVNFGEQFSDLWKHLPSMPFFHKWSLYYFTNWSLYSFHARVTVCACFYIDCPSALFILIASLTCNNQRLTFLCIADALWFRCFPNFLWKLTKSVPVIYG